jgi:hypothetical protein
MFSAAAPTDWIHRVVDPQIRAGVQAAVNQNLIPAADQQAYPGHFYINADGGGYGSDTTWPGLDSWQMAGAYLLLGKMRLVLDYFDFVRASQRKDGNIPFAIFSGATHGDKGYLQGLKWPDDVFTYKPPIRDGLPTSSQVTRQWIGLFNHWEVESKPLGALGPVCYILTAAEIYQATHDRQWLLENLDSVKATGRYLLTQISAKGLLGGSGFYTERPPRNGWDGVAQCYGVKAFHDLESLCKAAGESHGAKGWRQQADKLAQAFRNQFWVRDHFGEYIHVAHGLVDDHGLSDTNWAAIAFGLATPSQTKVLWPLLTSDKGFWPGGMPTIPVTKPFSYQNWEHEYVSFAVGTELNDVASMGRTWYLEALACQRMKGWDRLKVAARHVALAAKDGYWRERYHPQPDGTVHPEGSEKYCEYPAVLIRVILTNPKVFLKGGQEN